MIPMPDATGTEHRDGPVQLELKACPDEKNTHCRINETLELIAHLQLCDLKLGGLFHLHTSPSRYRRLAKGNLINAVPLRSLDAATESQDAAPYCALPMRSTHDVTTTWAGEASGAAPRGESETGEGEGGAGCAEASPRLWWPGCSRRG